MSRQPTVREATGDDLSDARRVVSAAYGGARTAELLDAFVDDPVAWLDLAFVAEDKNGVCGVVVYTRGWLDSPTKLVEVLVLTPLAVHPDRQRIGIGTQLVKDSLHQVESRDEPLVFLEGDPGFFCRMGLVSGHELHFAAPSPRIPEPAFQVATLPGYDQQLMTGAVVYPDVWWRHDAVGVRPEV